MSEEYCSDRQNTAELYRLIILGLNKKNEAIINHIGLLKKESDRYVQKICELTGMNSRAVQNTDFDKLYSPDPITQLEINVINHLFRTRIENAEHQHNNYCKAIDKRVECINTILESEGKERI